MFPGGRQRRENLGHDSVFSEYLFVKSKVGVVVSQPGELLTTFKSTLVICVGVCTRDGGKRSIWDVEAVLPIFAVFTKSFFFLCGDFQSHSARMSCHHFYKQSSKKERNVSLMAAGGDQTIGIAETRVCKVGFCVSVKTCGCYSRYRTSGP